MKSGLNDNNREEWQIVKPDEAHIDGWRLIYVAESDGLFLEAYDEEDNRIDSLILEPYLLDEYILAFKQAAYHLNGEGYPNQEYSERPWEVILNPYDDEICVDYYMKFVCVGLYEVGIRELGELSSRVQLDGVRLPHFIEVLEDAKRYYEEWEIGNGY
ncbi:hypothetical protein QA599_17495 [Haloarculaceae archaeon H-GB1-1]|nr:hypothetical protein [Haloarculaceae archaeon H-GB1-1]